MRWIRLVMKDAFRHRKDYQKLYTILASLDVEEITLNEGDPSTKAWAEAVMNFSLRRGRGAQLRKAGAEKGIQK